MKKIGKILMSTLLVLVMSFFVFACSNKGANENGGDGGGGNGDGGGGGDVTKTETLNDSAYVTTPFAKNNNPVYQIENYAEKNSLTAEKSVNGPDKNSLLVTAKANSYLKYVGVDLTNKKALLLVASANTANAGKKIEIHVDAASGTKIGELTLLDKSEERYRINDTLAADFKENFDVVFNDHYTALTQTVGQHDLYFVFPEATTVDIDWFTVSNYAGPKDETKELKDKRMQWWRDAAYGQFIHFGAYSLLAGEVKKDDGTTYIRDSGHGAEWIMQDSGITKRKTYEEQATKLFNPSAFDAKQVVKEAKEAGQKYIVLTSRHHEGLSMYDTDVREFSDYSIMNDKSSPAYEKREDITKELAKECEAQGIHFGVYTTIMDFHDASQDFEGRTNPGTNSAPERNLKLKSDVNEYITRLKAQMRELMVEYGSEIFFFDGSWVGWWNSSIGKEVERYMRTINPNVIINNRVGKSAKTDGDYGTPEKEIPATGLDYDWESCMTLNDTWGYNKRDTNWKQAQEVIDMTVKCASGGGNLLLNVGPKGDGTLPAESSRILKEAGVWLKKFGESVYNTDKHCFDTMLPNGIRTTTVPKDSKNPNNSKIYIHLGNETPASVNQIILPALENNLISVMAWDAAGVKNVVVPSTVKNNVITLNVSGVPKQTYNTVIEVTLEGVPKQATGGSDSVNIARGATVTESTKYNDDNSGAKLVDGDIATRWAPIDSNDAQWAILNLGSAKTFNKLVLKEWNDASTWQDDFIGYRCNSFSIETSNTGEAGSWTNIHTGTTIGASLDIALTSSVTAQYVKINLLGTQATHTETHLKRHTSLWEVEIYNANTSVDVSSDISNVTSLPLELSGTAIGISKVKLILKENSSDVASVVFEAEITVVSGAWSVSVPIGTVIPNGQIRLEVQGLDVDGNLIKAIYLLGNFVG